MSRELFKSIKDVQEEVTPEILKEILRDVTFICKGVAKHVGTVAPDFEKAMTKENPKEIWYQFTAFVDAIVKHHGIEPEVKRILKTWGIEKEIAELTPNDIEPLIDFFEEHGEVIMKLLTFVEALQDMNIKVAEHYGIENIGLTDLILQRRMWEKIRLGKIPRQELMPLKKFWDRILEHCGIDAEIAFK